MILVGEIELQRVLALRKRDDGFRLALAEMQMVLVIGDRLVRARNFRIDDQVMMSRRRLIHAGGPFPHRKDGTVFGNRERSLPAQRRGFYREYTVDTPGSRDRGARRIVCGGEPPTRPVACFYTADHYTTFRQIDP